MRQLVAPLISVQNRHRFPYPNSLLDPSPGTILFPIQNPDVVPIHHVIIRHNMIRNSTLLNFRCCQRLRGSCVRSVSQMDMWKSSCTGRRHTRISIWILILIIHCIKSWVWSELFWIGAIILWQMIWTEFQKCHTLRKPWKDVVIRNGRLMLLSGPWQANR